MQNYFNPYFIPPLITSLLLLFLGIFVYTKNRKSLINILFSLECIVSFIWQFSYSMMYYFSYIERLATFWMKIGYVGVIYISAFYYHFVIEFLERKKERIVAYISYVIATIFVYFHLTTNLFTNGVIKYFWGYYPRASTIHPIFLVFFIGLVGLIIFHTLMGFLRRNQLFTDRRRDQIKYLFWAFFLYSPACLDYVANYNIALYPFGYIFATAFLAIIAYAIVKHQLLDIKVIIKKTLVYSILISIITVLYLVLIFFLEKVFCVAAGYQSLPLTIAVITLFSIMFIPLKNKIQRAIDKHYFKGSIGEIVKEKELLEAELQRSERLKAISTLAAGMAHEIKNPLTSIKTFVEYVDKKYKDPTFKKSFNSIVPKEIDKITKIVNELLNYSKTDRIELGQHNIHDILDYTLNLYSNEFIKKGIKVHKSYSSQIKDITCDENQLKQAFINIILNSIEAMPKGGKLTVETKYLDKALEVSISDTGVGILKEKLESLFNPFYTTKEKGTGLGLFIVHQIIENNSGRIAISSDINKGTTVKVRFSKC